MCRLSFGLIRKSPYYTVVNQKLDGTQCGTAHVVLQMQASESGASRSVLAKPDSTDREARGTFQKSKRNGLFSSTSV